MWVILLTDKTETQAKMSFPAFQLLVMFIKTSFFLIGINTSQMHVLINFWSVLTPWNDLSVIHLLHIAAAELEGPEITSSLISSFQRTILALYTSQPNLFSCGSGLCCIILWRSEWKGFGVFDARHQVTKRPLIVLRFQTLRSPVVGAGVVCIFRCKLLKPIHTKKQHISIPRRTDPRLRGNSAQHKKKAPLLKVSLPHINE